MVLYNAIYLEPKRPVDSWSGIMVVTSTLEIIWPKSWSVGAFCDDSGNFWHSFAKTRILLRFDELARGKDH